LTSETDKKVKSLEGLLEVARAMTIEKDLDKLLELILDATTRVLRADRSSLLLYDADRNELFARIAQKERREIRFKANLGIAGAAATERTIVNVKNPYADSRFNKDIDRQTGYRTRNILAAPLITHEEKLIGVLEAINKTEEDCFSKDDEALMEAFASHAALAIDNNSLIRHYLEKKKMEHALQIARQIQQNLLPQKSPEFAGLEISSLSMPCDETGGDYFDYFAAGERLFTIIGDVTGHGIGPALIMSEVRALIHAVAHTSEEIGPASILSIVNRLLAGDLTEGRFVTLFLGIFDKERNIRFSSAGHGNVYHFLRKEDTINELEPTGLPLGIMEGSSFDEGKPVRMQNGDVILFATDGIEESANAAGEQFGRENLFKALRESAGRSAAGIVEKVYCDLKNFAGAQPQRDDITMFAIKAKGR